MPQKMHPKSPQSSPSLQFLHKITRGFWTKAQASPHNSCNPAIEFIPAKPPGTCSAAAFSLQWLEDSELRATVYRATWDCQESKGIKT